MKATELLIVFIKNKEWGEVKTRLAATIGNETALEVYGVLMAITREVVNQLRGVDVHLYFSKEIAGEGWSSTAQFVQRGTDLGQRMGDAFARGFERGYQRIVGIGTDLPDLSPSLIYEALTALEERDTVFGPARDGGYYLLGMRRYQEDIFKDKAWSTATLLADTLSAIRQQQLSTQLLPELNDIDDIDDLMHSSIADRCYHSWNSENCKAAEVAAGRNRGEVQK